LWGLKRIGGVGKTRVRRQSAPTTRHVEEADEMPPPNNDADESAQATKWEGSAPCHERRPSGGTARRGDIPKPSYTTLAQASCPRELPHEPHPGCCCSLIAPGSATGARHQAFPPRTVRALMLRLRQQFATRRPPPRIASLPVPSTSPTVRRPPSPPRTYPLPCHPRPAPLTRPFDATRPGRGAAGPCSVPPSVCYPWFVDAVPLPYCFLLPARSRQPAVSAPGRTSSSVMWWVEEGSPRVVAKRRGGDSLPPGQVQSQISGSERAAGMRLGSSAHRRMARRTPETNTGRWRSIGGRRAGDSQACTRTWRGHACSGAECEHELGADADEHVSP